jgi:competence protein ComEA
MLLCLLLWVATALATVDVNSADQSALESLPGIGEKTAQAILAYREEHGPFHNLDELDAVKGIGPATIEKLRDQVSFGTTAASTSDTATSAAAPATTLPSAAATTSTESAPAATVASAGAGCPVNINTADATGLDVLPGVGEAKAADILAYRQANGPFSSCDGLDAVKGFGSATIDKLRSCCVVK